MGVADVRDKCRVGVSKLIHMERFGKYRKTESTGKDIVGFSSWICRVWVPELVRRMRQGA